MVIALPSRVMNFKVSAASPTDELITIGQILSEVGNYACTILDKEHLSFARKCANRLKKVVGELVSRGSIKSQDDLYEIEKGNAASADLSTMTIEELHRLYRQWPIRHQVRLIEGREHMTYYFEGQIIRELQNRKPSTKDEQLKIDYCNATYNNELDNMSFIFSCPVGTDNDKTYPDMTKEYLSDELAELIKRYSHYTDIAVREILIEYVDFALDLLEHEGCSQRSLRLLSALADLDKRKIIRVPGWINVKLNQLN